MEMYSADGATRARGGRLRPITVNIQVRGVGSSGGAGVGGGDVKAVYESGHAMPPSEITIYPWLAVQHIKQKLRGLTGMAEAQQRLFYGGVELTNSRCLDDYNVADGDSLVLVPATFGRIPSSPIILELYGDLPCADRSRALLQRVRHAMLLGLAPKLTLDGTGGTYLLRDATKHVVAVLKPADEEPFAPNNPRGHVGRMGQPGFRNGILSGEAVVREVAASLLDRSANGVVGTQGFAGVPLTTLVEVQHPSLSCVAHLGSSRAPVPKIGSMQEYVVHDDIAGDLSAHLFPTLEVHKIAVLDLRLVNTDRNDANVLVVRQGGGRLELIPIDHGLILPDTLEVHAYDLAWMEWPQARVPFSADTRDYIARLRPEDDAALLRRVLGVREQCLRNMRIAVRLLQAGAAAGMTPFEIASVLCRPDLDVPSELEVLIASAEALARSMIKFSPAMELNLTAPADLSGCRGGGKSTVTVRQLTPSYRSAPQSTSASGGENSGAGSGSDTPRTPSFARSASDPSAAAADVSALEVAAVALPGRPRSESTEQWSSPWDAAMPGGIPPPSPLVLPPHLGGRSPSPPLSLTPAVSAPAISTLVLTGGYDSTDAGAPKPPSQSQTVYGLAVGGAQGAENDALSSRVASVAGVGSFERPQMTVCTESCMSCSGSSLPSPLSAMGDSDTTATLSRANSTDAECARISLASPLRRSVSLGCLDEDRSSRSPRAGAPSPFTVGDSGAITARHGSGSDVDEWDRRPTEAVRSTAAAPTTVAFKLETFKPEAFSPTWSSVMPTAFTPFSDASTAMAARESPAAVLPTTIKRTQSLHPATAFHPEMNAHTFEATFFRYLDRMLQDLCTRKASAHRLRRGTVSHDRDTAEDDRPKVKSRRFRSQTVDLTAAPSVSMR